MAPAKNIKYDPNRDFYDILGVPIDANVEMIQRAYRTKAKEVHPDLNPEREGWAKAQFQLLSEAYSVLSDVESRQEYNNQRWLQTAMGRKAPPSFNAHQAWNNYQQSQAYRPPPPPPPNSAYYRYQPPANDIDLRGQFLSDLGLNTLRPHYVALHNLLGSPYRYMLFILGTLVVGLTLFVIGGAAFSNGFDLREPDESVQSPLSPILATATPVPTQPPTVFDLPSQVPFPTLTPVSQTANCDPRATFLLPANAAIGQNGLEMLRGTVNHPDMASYKVEADYLGGTNSGPSLGNFILRPDEPQSEPILNGVVADLKPLYELEGFYSITLTVTLLDGTTLAPCSVILR